MSLSISLIPTSEVMRVWDRVSHMLKRATDISQGRYRLIDVKEKLLTGEFNLWVVFDPEFRIVAAITSTFTFYPQGKFLHGQFLGGDRLDEWRDQFCDIFDRWGKDNACKAIEFSGRAGWVRALAGNGYREVFRVLQKDLK